MRLEELLHRIGVPLVDGERFAHDAIAVHHFDDRIQAANVLDLQVGEFGRSIAFDECLDLWVGTKLAGAHLEDGASVFPGNGPGVFFAAALATVISVGVGVFSGLITVPSGGNTHCSSSSPKSGSLSHDEQTSCVLMKPSSLQSCVVNSAVAS